MADDIKRAIESARKNEDVSIEETLTVLERSYSRVLELTKGNIEEYPNVKSLKEHYVPGVIDMTERYWHIYSESGSEEQFKLRNELMELIHMTIRSCENVLSDLEEALALDLSVDIEVLNNLLKGSGMTGSDFDIFDRKGIDHIRNAAGKDMKGDPFTWESISSGSGYTDWNVLLTGAGDGDEIVLKKGYKREYDLQYEYFDDYYPVRTSGESLFSNIIDDLLSDVDKAKRRIASMLESVFKDKLICCIPDVGYRSLIDSIKMTSPESGLVSVQVIGIDHDNDKKGVYAFNGEENIIKKDLILLGALCQTGEEFAKCRKVLFESGAAIVRCVAIGRKADEIPDEHSFAGRFRKARERY